ncbi:MAG: DUF2938 domain-containing protein [Woeseiaceae bacterium]
MNEGVELGLRALVIGIGATVVLDLWSALLKQLGVPSTRWGMVGRWVGHLPDGHFVHENIAGASQVRGEVALGWTTHYFVGVVFASLLLLIVGLDWAREPTVLPPLAFGAVTVVFPFFVLQPGMGVGIAASKAPDPLHARLRSIGSHLVFGLGMYLSAMLSVWQI